MGNTVTKIKVENLIEQSCVEIEGGIHRSITTGRDLRDVHILSGRGTWVSNTTDT